MLQKAQKHVLRVSIHERRFLHPKRSDKKLEKIRKCSKMFENAWKCPEMLENNWKCVKCSKSEKNAWKFGAFSEILEGLGNGAATPPNHFQIIQNERCVWNAFSACVTMLENAQKYVLRVGIDGGHFLHPKRCDKIRKISKMFENARKHSKICIVPVKYI